MKTSVEPCTLVVPVFSVSDWIWPQPSTSEDSNSAYCVRPLAPKVKEMLPPLPGAQWPSVVQ
ncbi:hypothetical protein X759_33720 [Mesorhizobium sp. LSHC420B00]|nr:hypothetical protein X759_33720 [Mesorhizobium sp. LSHC420B00]